MARSFFKSQRSLEQWLADYAVSHQHPINKKIHWLCVPIIFTCIAGMSVSFSVWFTLILSALVLLFYIRLSAPLFLAMGIFMLFCFALITLLPVGFKFWAALFVLAWIGQFIGHKLEGKKPSFFEDLQFLLIGPAWLAASLMGHNIQPAE
ncbi:Mpo1 family 2-hydroxy fatty acid dioxygenase [Psychrobacter sp. I-STPA10]|uniref:Mpo1 family 2-hydroxy fatty acid dioxygenase n=1 Tax=Psychrobacter sp. I-STPA10 TaxID=2585769 RepID=UPI001E3BAC8A|nr:Mpo1-like protein [Psychrobacter sp. I-STPA10]